MKGLFGISALPLLAAASPLLKTAVHNDQAAPLVSSSNAVEIPDSYIIKFKDHVTHTLAAEHHSWVQDLHLDTQTRKTELRKRSQMPFSDAAFEGLKHTYNIAGSWLGYSGHFDEDVIEQLRNHPDVSPPVPPPQHRGGLALSHTAEAYTRLLLLLHSTLLDRD